MYRKGLTVGRIAAVCGALPQTVGSHIRTQRAAAPEMAAEHLANRPTKRPRPPGAAWRLSLEALAKFRESAGRYPTSHNRDPVNRRLANWLSIQRRAARAGRLDDERLRLLAVLPGWDVDQRSTEEAERWRNRLEELRMFKASEGRWPQFRRPVGEDERVLGVWLHSQRLAFGGGRLDAEALRLLDVTIPGWNAWRVKHLAKIALDA
ncbi:hypothetical protein SRABI26_02684 [Arthrobacter sp. Bi26]|nr:hypothetical protein SRABI26_02684 [Arthrobacter sp. Bi26]